MTFWQCVGEHPFLTVFCLMMLLSTVESIWGRKPVAPEPPKDDT